MLFKTNYFCSPVQGQLLYEGKPLAGVKVVRTLTADGLENGRYEDYAITNEEGFFEMPEVSNKTFLVRPQFFSGNPGVAQFFDTSFQGEKYSLWANSKSGFEKGGETSEPAIKMICDLSKSERSERFGIFYANCNVKGYKNQ